MTNSAIFRFGAAAKVRKWVEQPAKGNGSVSSQKWAARGTIAIGFLCLLGWVYAPVLTGQYGWNDDYPLLKRVADGSFDVRHNEFVEVVERANPDTLLCNWIVEMERIGELQKASNHYPLSCGGRQ